MGLGYLNSVGYRETLDALVVAFCRDYFERKRVIEEVYITALREPIS